MMIAFDCRPVNPGIGPAARATEKGYDESTLTLKKNQPSGNSHASRTRVTTWLPAPVTR